MKRSMELRSCIQQSDGTFKAIDATRGLRVSRFTVTSCCNARHCGHICGTQCKDGCLSRAHWSSRMAFTFAQQKTEPPEKPSLEMRRPAFQFITSPCTHGHFGHGPCCTISLLHRGNRLCQVEVAQDHYLSKVNQGSTSKGVQRDRNCESIFGWCNKPSRRTDSGSTQFLREKGENHLSGSSGKDGAPLCHNGRWHRDVSQVFKVSVGCVRKPMPAGSCACLSVV